MKEASLWVSLDDLIFEHRNKLYGAYALRKDYPQHLAYSMLAVFAALLLLFPMADMLRERAAQGLNAMPVEKKHGPTIFTDVFILPPVPKPEPAVEQPQARTAAPGTRLVPEIDPRPETGAVQPIEGSLTGGGETGSETGTAAGTGPVDSAGAGTGTGTAPVVESDSYVHDYAEKLPVYPGGDAALYKFISSHIRYPSGAVAAGIEGRVFVSFVCDKNGQVSNVKIVKGIGGGLDEEAVRVVKLLKGFSPALQAGRPVNYRYVLPVRFRL